MRILLVFLLLGLLVIGGIGTYLAPDTLDACDSTPAATTGICEPADAIIAISGGDTAARADEAVLLYKNGWAELLIFSGAAADKSGPSNAAAMKARAVNAGVPESAILIEERSETTRQNALRTQELMEHYAIDDVILVTSAYHQRRAGLEFQQRSSGVISIRNHPVRSDNQWSSWWWTTPSGWYLAAGELVKIVVFYFGGIR